MIKRQRVIKEVDRIVRLPPEKSEDVSANGEHERVFTVEFDGVPRNNERAFPVGVRIELPALADSKIEPPSEVGVCLWV